MLKNETLRRDADVIIRASLNAVLPDEAVRRALKNFRPQGGFWVKRMHWQSVVQCCICLTIQI